MTIIQNIQKFWINMRTFISKASNLQVMKKERGPTTAIACFLLLFLFILAFLKDPAQEILRSSSPSTWKSDPTRLITCNRSHQTYDICSINGPTVLDPTTYTFFMIKHTDPAQQLLTEYIHPYPRKRDKSAMATVKEVTITSGSYSPQCDVQHNAPALVFSAGGYTGNFFHEFNDGFVPLFITVNSFNHDQNVVLVITNCKSWWLEKYGVLLRGFSRHPVINMDNSKISHCFPSATIGLIKHGPMTVDPTLLPRPKTILDFHAFLESAYSQGSSQVTLSQKSRSRPRLVIVNRKGNVGRVILNQAEVKEAAEATGFDVIVLEPIKADLVHTFKLINSSHAMLGVHGAGLTHSLFLRPRSVLLQVVPIGLEWLSKTYFEKPARKLRLEYMEYKVRAEESNLMEIYGKNNLVVQNPKAYVNGNWSSMHVYLKVQNVRLDIVSFRRYLKKAYKKAKRLMESES